VPLDAEQVLAFRLARSGLARRDGASLPEAAACPAPDFSAGSALLALAARTAEIDRQRYDDAVDRGDVIVAYIMRGAIHALAPADFALYGRALIAGDNAELAVQLGKRVQELTNEPVEALEEVAEATLDALAQGPLDKNALHAALRERVRPDLMPWCKGCGSHHVSPMLWRYATVKAGVRLDSRRRYTPGEPGRTPDASEAVRRFLHFYGPATPKDFAEFAGLAKPHAQRLWDAVATEDGLLPEDADALANPPQAEGIRLRPPGDPYLQKPNRALLAPDPALRKRLFPAIAGPGAVLHDGRLAGLWRPSRKGKRLELKVEPLAKLPKRALQEEAQRVAALRGASDVVLT
jgi:hypothetical protein